MEERTKKGYFGHCKCVHREKDLFSKEMLGSLGKRKYLAWVHVAQKDKDRITWVGAD